jgi:hypothetical protein
MFTEKKHRLSNNFPQRRIAPRKQLILLDIFPVSAAQDVQKKRGHSQCVLKAENLFRRKTKDIFLEIAAIKRKSGST